MDDQNKNLILATALSFLVILVWFALFPPPEVDPGPDATQQTNQTSTDGAVVPAAPATGDAAAPAIDAAPQTRADALANAPRVAIETPRLTGSISLLGGRIDDLKLKDYRETLDDGAPIVTAGHQKPGSA